MLLYRPICLPLAQAKIARALTPLCRLETLRMYPGFRPASAPQPFIPIPHFGPFRENREVVRLDRVRDRAAQTIANTMGPSLRTIFLLHPSQPPSFYWMEYHVVPAPYGTAVEDHRGLGRGYHLKVSVSASLRVWCIILTRFVHITVCAWGAPGRAATGWPLKWNMPRFLICVSLCMFSLPRPWTISSTSH